MQCIQLSSPAKLHCVCKSAVSYFPLSTFINCSSTIKSIYCLHPLICIITGWLSALLHEYKPALRFLAEFIKLSSETLWINTPSGAAWVCHLPLPHCHLAEQARLKARIGPRYFLCLLLSTAQSLTCLHCSPFLISSYTIRHIFPCHLHLWVLYSLRIYRVLTWNTHFRFLCLLTASLVIAEFIRVPLLFPAVEMFFPREQTLNLLWDYRNS